MSGQRRLAQLAVLGLFPVLAQARRNQPHVDLSTMAVCEQQILCLEHALAEAAKADSAGQGGNAVAARKGALLKIGSDLSYTAPAQRPEAVACLRPSVRLSAPLPDGSALLSSVVPNCQRAADSEAASYKPCAVLVGAPPSLSAAALFVATPTTFAPAQHFAVLSEPHAIEMLDLWNVYVLSNRHPEGKSVDLPLGTIYVAPYDGLRQTAAIYSADGRLDLAVPKKELIEKLRAGDLQLLGAFDRFAQAGNAGTPRVVRIFTGFQDVELAGTESAPPPSQLWALDQRAVAEALARGLPALARLELEPPQIHLVRLRVTPGGQDQRQYQYKEEPLALAAAAGPLRSPALLAESRLAPWGPKLSAAAAGLALGGLLLSLARLFRYRRRVLDEQARNPELVPATLVRGFIARGDALGNLLRFALPALLMPVLLGVAGGAASWPRGALGAGGLLLVLLALLFVCDGVELRRRRAAISSQRLGEHYGERVRKLWQDLSLLTAQGEPGDTLWQTERRLRTELADSLPLRWHLRRLLRQPWVFGPALAGLLAIFWLGAALPAGGRRLVMPVAAKGNSPAEENRHKEASQRLAPPAAGSLAACLHPDPLLQARNKSPEATVAPERRQAGKDRSAPRTGGVAVPMLGALASAKKPLSGAVAKSPPAGPPGAEGAAARARDAGYLLAPSPFLDSRGGRR